MKQRLAAHNDREEGLKIATDIMKKVREIEGIRGIHIRPLGGGEESIGTIIENAGFTSLKTAVS